MSAVRVGLLFWSPFVERFDCTPNIEANDLQCSFSLDERTLECEINTLRDGLKPKVKELHKLEGKNLSRNFFYNYSDPSFQVLQK